MLASEGRNHRDRQGLKHQPEMTRLWRNRWLALSQKDVPVVERLQDAERCGAPASFSLEQMLQLFAIACEKPESTGDQLVIGRPENWRMR